LLGLTKTEQLQALSNKIGNLSTVSAQDEKQGIERVGTPYGFFWIKRSGEEMNGEQLLAYLLAEHEWMRSSNPTEGVRQGDVVMDCGAHVGVFVRRALQWGAKKVIAIEPEPANLLCLYKNFQEEINKSKVIVVAKGVWSHEDSISLRISNSNSGMNTMVTENAEIRPIGEILVPVTTVDQLVDQLGLDKVNLIKIDIEGAEREALKGASKTLQKFKPRLMMDAYHLPDDMEVLPRIVFSSNPAYKMLCGPCEPGGSNVPELVPHVIYFQ
jgi:FkbM family methyltransferase